MSIWLLFLWLLTTQTNITHADCIDTLSDCTGTGIRQSDSPICTQDSARCDYCQINSTLDLCQVHEQTNITDCGIAHNSWLNTFPTATNACTNSSTLVTWSATTGSIAYWLGTWFFTRSCERWFFDTDTSTTVTGASHCFAPISWTDSLWSQATCGTAANTLQTWWNQPSANLCGIGSVLNSWTLAGSRSIGAHRRICDNGWTFNHLDSVCSTGWPIIGQCDSTLSGSVLSWGQVTAINNDDSVLCATWYVAQTLTSSVQPWYSLERTCGSYNSSLNETCYAAQSCTFNGATLFSGQSRTWYIRSSISVLEWTSCEDASNAELFTCDWSGNLTGSNGWSAATYTNLSCGIVPVTNCFLFDGTIVPDGSIITAYQNAFVSFDVSCTDNSNSLALTCNGWVLTGSTSDIDSYKYSSCNNVEAASCTFGDTTIDDGNSIIAYLDPAPTAGQLCQSETRTCTNGLLGGTYIFPSCREQDGLCGSASTFTHNSTPTDNLCLAWSPTSITLNTSSLQRERQCLGFGWSDATCTATYSPTPVVSGICGIFPDPLDHLDSNNPTLCSEGNPSDFTTTPSWRSRACMWPGWVDNDCSAQNNTSPSAHIIYDPDEETTDYVTATLTWFTKTGTIIDNNNGNNQVTFKKNGSFTRRLIANGDTWFVKATVDRIYNTQELFEELISSYNENMCHIYDRIVFEDIQRTSFKLDVTTMLKNCIMQWFRYKNRYLFLPNKAMTRGNFLLAISRMGSKISHYEWLIQIDERNERYVGVEKDNPLAASIQRAEQFKIINHFPYTMQGNKVFINFEEKISQNEVQKILKLMLERHQLDQHLVDKLFRELWFQDDHYITRGEVAYLLRRIIEPYDEIPVGNDSRFLEALNRKIREREVDEQREFIMKLALAMRRISPDRFHANALTKRRMLEDLQAILRNELPQRRAKTYIDLQILRNRLHIFQEELFYNSDNLEDILEEEDNDF